MRLSWIWHTNAHSSDHLSKFIENILVRAQGCPVALSGTGASFIYLYWKQYDNRREIRSEPETLCLSPFHEPTYRKWVKRFRVPSSPWFLYWTWALVAPRSMKVAASSCKCFHQPVNRFIQRMRFRFNNAVSSMSASAVTKWFLGICRKLLDLATSKFNTALDNLSIFTRNDVTDFFRSAANRIYVFISGHFRVAISR